MTNQQTSEWNEAIETVKVFIKDWYEYERAYHGEDFYSELDKLKKHKFTIYLDFDGTVVEHAYPRIGRCNFGSIEVIKKLQDAGHNIILNTYRADINDGSLEAALKYINENYLMLIKDVNQINTFELKPILIHTPFKVHPKPWNWNLMLSNGEIYIDDIALGMPLKNAVVQKNKMVDWDIVDQEFTKYKIY